MFFLISLVGQWYASFLKGQKHDMDIFAFVIQQKLNLNLVRSNKMHKSVGENFKFVIKWQPAARSTILRCLEYIHNLGSAESRNV